MWNWSFHELFHSITGVVGLSFTRVLLSYWSIWVVTYWLISVWDEPRWGKLQKNLLLLFLYFHHRELYTVMMFYLSISIMTDSLNSESWQSSLSITKIFTLNDSSQAFRTWIFFSYSNSYFTSRSRSLSYSKFFLPFLLSLSPKRMILEESDVVELMSGVHS